MLCDDDKSDFSSQCDTTAVGTEDHDQPTDLEETADFGADLPPAATPTEACEFPEQTGKLPKVLADLKIATLKIDEQIRKQLIQVVKKNLDAFAGSPTDLGRTSVVVHTIRTCEAILFKHKLRPIPFARHQYLEQEVERLMSFGAVSHADPSACP